jgi:prepilin-type N-terminal cleavage/methylation domain-containing protein
MFKRNRQRGFTLIELLIVVAIIGIIAAILIPNLLDALQKAKQKRTVADIRDVGTAWMAWLTDQVGGASAGAAAGVKIYNGGLHTDLAYANLFNYLHPSTTFFYMQEVPQLDGWNYEVKFGASLNDLASQDAVMIICSSGRGGALTANDCTRAWNVEPFVSTDYDQDIVWADGYFVRWPK